MTLDFTPDVGYVFKPENKVLLQELKDIYDAHRFI